jgi:hypothetical protein
MPGNITPSSRSEPGVDQFEPAAKRVREAAHLVLGLYAAGAFLSFVLQAIIRLEVCAGLGSCGISLAKSAIWSAIWPVYWPIYLTP